MVCAMLSISGFARGVEWKQIIETSFKPPLPAPQEKVIWRGDLIAAVAEAKSTNRPLFVTFRCLPCKQCSAFDKDVLEGGGELDPLLKQFITVRLISAKDIDFRIFPAEGWQDMDLSWWGYVLSPDARIYGIFGGRDEVSDETRISVAALVKTLDRVLAHNYDPRRSSWDIDGPAPDLSGKPKLATDLPGWPSWSHGRAFDKRTQEAGCLHCHQVIEIMRQPAIDGHTFDKRKDTEIWPLPENVGIKVDRDDGLQVTQVAPGSPAAKAGITVGDELAAAGGRRLFGQADLRGVLHRGPKGAGTLEVWWTRGGKAMSGILGVGEGWRKTDLGWRTSIAGGNIGGNPGFWPVPLTAGDRTKLAIPEGTMAVHPYGVSPEAKAVGLAPQSIVTAVDDQKSDIGGRPWLIWFRMTHEPGDSITVSYRDPGGAEKRATYRIPSKSGG
jgi:hypothetical protein